MKMYYGKTESHGSDVYVGNGGQNLCNYIEDISQTKCTENWWDTKISPKDQTN